jgi:aminotransferase
VTDTIRKVHDFLTVGAPAPFQEAVAVGLETLPKSFYDELRTEFRERRGILLDALRRAGFAVEPSHGSYYLYADFAALSQLDAPAFARWLCVEGGVATVPGTMFYVDPAEGRTKLRVAFCKTRELLLQAAEKLARLPNAR